MDDISQGILSWQGSSNISTIFYVTTAVRFDHIEDAILIILSRIQRPFLDYILAHITISEAQFQRK